MTAICAPNISVLDCFYAYHAYSQFLDVHNGCLCRRLPCCLSRCTLRVILKGSPGEKEKLVPSDRRRRGY